jgi:hypothetical protein
MPLGFAAFPGRVPTDLRCFTTQPASISGRGFLHPERELLCQDSPGKSHLGDGNAPRRRFDSFRTVLKAAEDTRDKVIGGRREEARQKEMASAEGPGHLKGMISET